MREWHWSCTAYYVNDQSGSVRAGMSGSTVLTKMRMSKPLAFGALVSTYETPNAHGRPTRLPLIHNGSHSLTRRGV
jgi:hypothetical protein